MLRYLTFALLAAVPADSDPQDKASLKPLPNRTRSRAVVAARPWAKGLKQIPSTVIDKGVLRHVPYTSYRAGEYELNVYGDPAAPACVEIGIHGKLLESPAARKNCFDVMNALFTDPEDRKLLASLNQREDKKTRGAVTFEVTPPTAEDAYGGWWISVYNEALLDASRATPKELEQITTTRQQVRKTDAERPKDAPLPVEPVAEGRWGAEDLQDARKRADVPEENQAVYKPVYSRKNGVYVPDRSEDDTGYIFFVCANSDKHEDREELLKSCPGCKKDSTFFWDGDQNSFVCFKCGVPYDNSLVKCTICGKAPRRVRTKHR
jgi:hypothetical protein